MKIQNQVCSLDQAKRLKELGIVQQGYFFHIINIASNNQFIDDWDSCMNAYDANGWDIDDLRKVASAFTASELGEMLGPDITWNTSKTRARYWCFECEYLKTPFTDFRSEAEARAELLLLLLEYNHITPEVVNIRLIND